MNKKRISIGFFGLRNSGKSSLVNRITNQDMSVVSDVKGTTTDSVKKSMELLPIGPVTIIDTPGFDDEGELGEKRIVQTRKILRSCDIAVLVTSLDNELAPKENELIEIFKEREIPYVIAKNKVDLITSKYENKENIVYVSATQNIGIEELKNVIGKSIKEDENRIHFVSDFVNEKDVFVLVTPIDSSAPRGRLILPQQLAIREILDKNGISVVTQVEELEKTLEMVKPKMVITDSQVFSKVKDIVPKDILLTSFSILMARYKGFLDTAVMGVKKLDELENGAKVLISEGCTHHRQCEDIGTVKLPKWIREYTKKDFDFSWSSGNGFPEDLKEYNLVIHCGGCMLNENEMKYRMETAIKQNVPFTNYGILISYINGTLERSLEFVKYN